MSHPKDPKRRRQNQKKNKRTQKSDIDEDFGKNEKKKEEQQGDILLLVRNFTWTVDPRNQEVWPNKIPAPSRKGQKRSQLFQLCQLPV